MGREPYSSFYESRLLHTCSCSGPCALPAGCVGTWCNFNIVNIGDCACERCGVVIILHCTPSTRYLTHQGLSVVLADNERLDGPSWEYHEIKHLCNHIWALVEWLLAGVEWRIDEWVDVLLALSAHTRYLRKLSQSSRTPLHPFHFLFVWFCYIKIQE